MSRRAAKHSGYTLIELLIAITIGGVILSVLSTLMSHIMVSHSASARHLHGVVALGRLGEQFRRDVRGSASAAIERADEQTGKLVLTLADGGRVEYAIDSGCAMRTQSAGGQPRRREAFVLGDMKVLGYQAEGNTNSPVSIVVGRTAYRAGDGDVITGQFEITALPRRYQNQEPAP